MLIREKETRSYKTELSPVRNQISKTIKKKKESQENLVNKSTEDGESVGWHVYLVYRAVGKR